ncbi:TetR/AcrR family transcriptional regulator [Rothia uropygialis]|uniref:TetR/AcrR family transcriptional regulator n=1 Tax=Kocuria sp. 36 TaxID=1415402 RepID=UPI001EE983C4|nr:TetR/AcrR family transcriptional regulator [Kocuria sp. 36]
MDQTVDLRTRRKLQTEREIHRAALELFEQQGVRATTVPEIAARAGVSPRTFFRYFSTKEEAALPIQRTMARAIDRVEFSASEPTAVLETVEDMMEATLSEPAASEIEDHRRISRLLARDPEFTVAATGEEKELLERLLDRLREQLPDYAGLQGLLICETALMGWHVAWRQWGEQAIQGTVKEPVDVYRECRAQLRSIVGTGLLRR